MGLKHIRCWYYYLKIESNSNLEAVSLQNMNTTRPINVYAELTPNPNSLKFVADVMLLEGGSIEYNHPDETTNCPLAAQLFAFSGVNKVFINTNFVTINKDSEVDWFDISNILREFIRGFLMSDEKLFLNSPFDENHIPNKKTKAATFLSAFIGVHRRQNHFFDLRLVAANRTALMISG